MSKAEMICGDVLDVLAGMEPESVSVCCTSPPYWSLRKYDAPNVVWGGEASCEHDWQDEHRQDERYTGKTKWQHIGEEAQAQGVKVRDVDPNAWGHPQTCDTATCSRCGAWRGQFGLEPTPELYVEHTLMVLRAIRRVLRPDGVVFWNIGDGYASGKGTAHNPGGGASSLDGHAKLKEAEAYTLDRHNKSDLDQWGLKPKDLVLMPERVALAAQADGWWVRSRIAWCKPNAMPESVRDRPTDAWEHIYLFTKSARYWWDQEAVREEPSAASLARISQPTFDQQQGGPKDYAKTGINRNRSARNALEGFAANPGRNLRNVWTFPTAQTPEAHFATFPEELPRRCILAACPPEICAKCGTARVRITSREQEPDGIRNRETTKLANDPHFDHRTQVGAGQKLQDWLDAHPKQTTGWTSCDCGIWTCDQCGLVLEYPQDEHETVRGMRQALPAEAAPRRSSRQADEILRQDMRESLVGTESSHEQGLDEDGQGLHSGVPTGASTSQRERLRDAAPAGDGEGARSAARAKRGRESQERRPPRQQAGKSGSHAEAPPRQATEAAAEAAPLSTLRRDDQNNATGDADCPSCGGRLAFTHAPWIPGLTLDPFCGIGTTGVVARRLGRRFVGIELSEKYAEMAREKLRLYWRKVNLSEPDTPEAQAVFWPVGEQA